MEGDKSFINWFYSLLWEKEENFSSIQLWSVHVHMWKIKKDSPTLVNWQLAWWNFFSYLFTYAGSFLREYITGQLIHTRGFSMTKLTPLLKHLCFFFHYLNPIPSHSNGFSFHSHCSKFVKYLSNYSSKKRRNSELRGVKPPGWKQMGKKAGKLFTIIKVRVVEFLEQKVTWILINVFRNEKLRTKREVPAAKKENITSLHGVIHHFSLLISFFPRRIKNI